MTTTLWRYDDSAWADLDLVDYEVEALDGEIGKIAVASKEIGARYLVVDTGPWIFGRQVMLPAGLVKRVDVENKRVYVGRSRAEIKNAPEFNLARHHDPRYREALTIYYSRNRPATSGRMRDDGRVRFARR